MGIADVRQLKIWKATTMVQVTGAALKENHPHEVRIVKSSTKLSGFRGLKLLF